MLEFMKFFSENWYVIFTFICAIILLVMKIIEFIGFPTEKKIAEVKHRLLSYVTKAETELGSRTGELKLATTYDYFCKEFPYLTKWIPYEDFKELVDEILPEMRSIIRNAGEPKEGEQDTESTGDSEVSN